MAVVINGNGAVTGLTALPDSAMATGSVIQTVSKIRTGSNFSTSSTSAQHISDFDADLTLASSSNKVFILITGGFISQSDNYENRVHIKLYEGSVQSSDEIFEIFHGGLTLQSSTTHYCQFAAGAGFYHTPGKTNPTYKLSIQCTAGGSNHIIQAIADRAVVTYFEVVA
tara:strand:+ start:807 stop:1313 length:507 start_codon:yes stop_codon:yes gene_type:complete